MVLPAELLTVGYAEPIRRWLRRRFESVRIVVIESLQFDTAQEKVVLLLANGEGGCEGFSLYHVDTLDELPRLAFSENTVLPSSSGKWTELLLRASERRLFKLLLDAGFAPLSEFGSVTLGTVTGANDFFTLSEATRARWDLDISDLVPIHPPGTRVLKGLAFAQSDWERLRLAGERVWLLSPRPGPIDSPGLRKYLEQAEVQGISNNYKCRSREPWWQVPLVPVPDLFFTYMSHHFPRLVTNGAKAFHLNSMHGVRLAAKPTEVPSHALPLLAINSLTLLGAELYGRSYGGGILKMEPREAASLPIPSGDSAALAWESLKPDAAKLRSEVRAGFWTGVRARVDEVLLTGVMGLSAGDVEMLRHAGMALRSRRTGKVELQ
jgi:hypothetical protein